MNLPDYAQAALDAALRSLPGAGAARVWGPANEGALNHVLFIETPATTGVLRLRRRASSQEIYNYLAAMYRCTGFPQQGGVFRLRTIDEELAFLQAASAQGLPVPAVLDSGHGWMLIERVQGRTAYAAVRGGDLSVVPLVLDALFAAHQRGVIYGDRWGDNELIEPSGRVRFIDFDVLWDLPGGAPARLAALEVAVYLFNTLRLSGDRPGVVSLVSQRLAPQLASRGYDMAELAEYFAGMGRFYLDPDKPGNQWSLPAELYRALAAPATAVERALRAHE